MQEWLNWPAWKASKPQKGFRGSNPLLSAAETRMRTGQQPVRIFHPDTLRTLQPLRAATAENRQSARNPIRKITPFVDTIAPLVYFNWTCTREWVALRQNRTK